MTRILNSPEAVIAAIQERHKEGETLTWFFVSKSDLPLIEAAEKHCGSWAEAIIAAGLPLSMTYSEKIYGSYKPKKTAP